MTLTARQWLARRWAAGQASKYIRPFSIKPGDRVVLVVRVSGHSQHKNKNLDDQEAFLRRVVEEAGGVVVGVVRKVISGWVESNWLWRARCLAKRHDAIILAESTDRFVRHHGYRSNRPTRVNLQATDMDLQDLAYTTRGTVLMTYLHPDTSPKDVRSHQRKRGQWAKENPGGRPAKVRYLPNYRTDHQARALAWKMFEKDASYGEIKAAVGRERSSLQYWKQQWMKGKLRS